MIDMTKKDILPCVSRQIHELADTVIAKRTVGESILDALGMGLGYLWVLCGISLVRELLGSGTLLGLSIIPESYTMAFFSRAPGGFFVFGMFIAVTQAIRKGDKK